MLRSLFCLVLFLTPAPSQGDPPPTIPNDPRAAVAEMPLHEPVEGGHPVEVVDGDTGAPLVGADVIVVSVSKDDRERLRALENAIQARLPEASREEQALVLAVIAGVRYRTDAAGRVAVDADEQAGLFVIHDGNFAMTQATREGPVKVFAPRWLEVRVTTADGKPAAGVPMGVDQLREGDRFPSRSFRPRVRAVTGADGTCRIDVAPTRLRLGDAARKLRVRAMVASSETLEVAVDLDDDATQPAQLQLPVCGQVRFILYGEDERPAGRLRTASISVPSQGQEFAFRLGAPPATLEADNATFAWVEIGHEVSIQASIEGLSEGLSFSGKGPTRAGEFVVVEGRMTSGPPILFLRVLDENGTPVANEPIGHVLRNETEHAQFGEAVNVTYGVTETDAEGRLEIPTTAGAFEALYLTRREKSEATRYRGGARVDLGELHPGRCDLGDIRLGEETVIARRQLVDETGAPVANAWIRGNATFASSPKGSMGGGGGSSRPGSWFIEHHVQTDAEGWFELREFAAAEGEYMFSVQSQDHVSPGGLWIEPHAGGPLTVYRASTIRATLGEGFAGIDCDARLTHRETGQVLSARFRDGKLEARWAAGTYDVVIGDEVGVTIEDVKAPAGEVVADERLNPVAFGDQARVVRVELVDGAGKPVPRGLIWLMVKRADGGGGGNGFYTDESGKAVILVAGSGAKDIASQELRVDVKGFAKQTLPVPDDSVRVVLRSIEPVALVLKGVPEVPKPFRLRAAASAVQRPGGNLFTTSGQTARDGTTIEILPEKPGPWRLQLYLEPARSAARLSNDVSNELTNRVTRFPIEFEFEIGKDRPREPMVFELSEEQKETLRELVETAQEIIEAGGDG